ncbi:hypothetical protein [Methylobacterium haplocladii]|uniref:Uncharacterized protein n=1 Tax=Methylobacterium haplocladii TaxID=1176176 RepID=A0A512IQ97_9HYPH|nr:hypothetical protein [Methylobacterium haplocladii]GEO99860.1 hypothetical protein MHA02_22480 [Methylobacterium haplocladii]GJD82780.1 hypothetical protein HPGCJGGD_0640 [Methylobacterium haplocladii]GLS58024.1 hypothetical protein GCM10007887_06800 [Methylobacterium haplocladii]
MKLTLAGRRSPVRTAARAVAARYAPVRSYDENAAFLTLGATLLASLVLVLGAIVLRG